MAKFKPYQTGLESGWTLNICDLLGKDHLVFFIEHCVSQLDTSKIEATYSCLGPNAFHPKLQLSVLFYGYMQGIRSGRKLATACKEQLPFIYLSKGYFPKKTAINDFRKANVGYFKDYFQKFLTLFDKNRKDASTSIFDGSKIAANASKYQTREKATYERWLVHLEEDIAAIEQELQELQEQEQKDLAKDLAKKKKLCTTISQLIAPLEKADDKINLIDPDAPRMKGKKGNTGMFYNVQVGCNSHQTILHAAVNQDGNDKKQLQPCIEGVQENTAQKVEQAIADPGYASFSNYEYLEEEGIIGYIPDQDFNKDFKDKPYHRTHFQKHPDKDEFICPQGNPLPFFKNKKDGNYQFKVYKATQCENCPVKKLCTKADFRTIAIEEREPLRQKMRQRLQSEEGREMYKKRLHPVEAIFAHLKFNLGYTYFLLRGLANVQAEFLLMCIGYNLMKLAGNFTFFEHYTSLKAALFANSFFIQFFQRTFCFILSKNIISTIY